MDEEKTRGKQRRNERDETNQEANRRNEKANKVVIDAEADELSLSLGSTSYSSKISSSMMLSPRLAQSSPSLPSSSRSLPTLTLPSADYEMIQPILYSSLLNNSLQQTGSQGFSPTMAHSGFSPSLTMAQSGFTPLPNQITSVIPAVPLSNQGIQIGNQQPAGNQNAVGIQINNQQPAGNQNADVIQPPPYPWATSRRAAVQSLENLEAKGITTITGEVECKHCDKRYQVSYNLRQKFEEIEYIFRTKIRLMRNRALRMWTNPEPRKCELCGHEKTVKPVIPQRKCHINWLFLFLGQTLGFCTLEQLKNFCKHCKSHRTGAKDRVLYLTYLGLCKMLKPNEELFNVRETIDR